MTTASAVMFEDPNGFPQIPQGGWIGVIGATVIGGVLWLRKFLSADSVTNAANTAQTELINLLRDQIKEERTRADAAEAARDAAIQTMQGMRLEMTQMKLQIASLEDTVRKQNGTVTVNTITPGALT